MSTRTIGKQCKICNHPHRPHIEQEYLSNRTKMKQDELIAEINKRYIANFSPVNFWTHMNRHLQPVIDSRARQLIEDAAIEQRDSLLEVDGMLAKCDATIEAVALDPNDEEFVRKVNAIRQLLNTRNQMMKLYAKLSGEDETKGKAPSLTKIVDEYRRLQEKIIVIEEKADSSGEV